VVVLRQAVLVARDRDDVCSRLQKELGLGDPFDDPGVGAFGLHNAVFALGDRFIEVVSPVRDGTTAGRYLDKNGDGGYMVIFQLDDLDAARTRIAERGIRVVWEANLDDISATHLHPADIGGAIVSVDRPDPPESWRWGGPDWIGRGGTGAPGELRGATVEVPDPGAVAARWAEVLGVEPRDGVLALDSGTVRFARGERGLTEIGVSIPGRGGAAEIGGVRFSFDQEETE
jgi:hypothetical protein